MRSAHARIEFLKKSGHLTDQALARDFRHFAHVLVGFGQGKGIKTKSGFSGSVEGGMTKIGIVFHSCVHVHHVSTFLGFSLTEKVIS